MSPPRLLLLYILLRLWRGHGGGHWRGRVVGWRRRRERALSPSMLRGQGTDTALLFYYCERPKIELLLVGQDASSRLMESFNNCLVGAASGRVLGTRSMGASISDIIGMSLSVSHV